MGKGDREPLAAAGHLNKMEELAADLPRTGAKVCVTGDNGF